MDRSVEGPIDGHVPSTWQWRIGGGIFEIPRTYTPIRAIGVGSYGCVCSAKHEPSGQFVAIKKISNAFENLQDAKRIVREIKLLRSFHHDYIISIVDMFPPRSKEDFNDIYIVNELMETDMAKVIRSANLSEEHIQYFLYQLIVGLKYIHSAGVLHRDLKPSNLLSNGDCLLTIADFGLARTQGLLGHMTEYVATRWYRAPEIILSWRHYSQAVDVWSAGCIFAEMILKRPLFPGRDFIDQIVCITDILGKPTDAEIAKIAVPQARAFLEQMPFKPRIPWAQLLKGASPLGLDLLDRMLCFDADKRWTAAQLLAHPYFESLHDEKDEPVADREFSFDFEQWQPSADVYKELILHDIRDFHPEAFQESPSFMPMPHHEMLLEEQQQRELQMEQERLEAEYLARHQATFDTAVQGFTSEGFASEQQAERLLLEREWNGLEGAGDMGEYYMGGWDGSDTGITMALGDSQTSLQSSEDGMIIQTPTADQQHGSFFQI